MSNHTRVQAKKTGDIDVSSTTTDAPILPIEQLAKLQEIAPNRVDWVFDHTDEESKYRRAETRRLNTMIFVERVGTLLFALLVAVMCLGASVYLAMHDKELVASIIGGTTVVGLVAAFIAGRKGGGSGAAEKPRGRS